VINPAKLFKTIGIDENIVQVKYFYTWEELLSKKNTVPYIISSITANKELGYSELNNEKSFLEKVQLVLKTMIDQLQYEIDEIEKFKGWYE